MIPAFHYLVFRFQLLSLKAHYGKGGERGLEKSQICVMLLKIDTYAFCGDYLFYFISFYLFGASKVENDLQMFGY